MTASTLTRRRNVQALFQSYAEIALAAGESPKGLEQSFAAQLQISPSMWSQIKSARPIGDKLARQIEAHCKKPIGWLDQMHADQSLSPEERAFLAVALQAWRQGNNAQRRDLTAYLLAVSNDHGTRATRKTESLRPP